MSRHAWVVVASVPDSLPPFFGGESLELRLRSLILRTDIQYVGYMVLRISHDRGLDAKFQDRIPLTKVGRHTARLLSNCYHEVQLSCMCSTL